MSVVKDIETAGRRGCRATLQIAGCCKSGVVVGAVEATIQHAAHGSVRSARVV